jgi:hypothetical protein
VFGHFLGATSVAIMLGRQCRRLAGGYLCHLRFTLSELNGLFRLHRVQLYVPELQEITARCHTTSGIYRVGIVRGDGGFQTGNTYRYNHNLIMVYMISSLASGLAQVSFSIIENSFIETSSNMIVVAH